MDTGYTRLRHLVLLSDMGSVGHSGARWEWTDLRCKELYRYFAECCDRYIDEGYIDEESAELCGKWAELERGRDPLNDKMAFVLQQTGSDPEDFGIQSLHLENMRWMQEFSERLSRAPLLWGEPSHEEADRRTEYLVLCWLGCVEQGYAPLQQAIRRCMGLKGARQLNVFQYLAAAVLLLMRNTRQTGSEAVQAFRREILALAPDAGLPSVTKSWSGDQLRRALTDDLLLQAFRRLQQGQDGAELSLPTLLQEDPDPALLRELALLPNAQTNDYLYLMESYLNRLFNHKGDWPCILDQAAEMAQTFCQLNLDTSEEEDEVQQALGTPPEEVEEFWKGDTVSPPPKEKPRRRGIKIPFRMLRHTLYLLIGKCRDRYFGRESDIRELAFRLAFACGMNREGMEQMLQEQQLPGIDFKTAPELLYAYYGDRLFRDTPPDGSLPAPGAYAAARLAQQVYDLREQQQEQKEDRPPLALEPTLYVRSRYQQMQPWEMPPRDFLDWMEARQIPAQSSEALVTRRKNARQLLVFCSQLFRARWALQRINRRAAEAQQHSSSPLPQKEYEAEQKSLLADSRAMEQILQQVNNGLPLFSAGEKKSLRTDLLEKPVELSPWRMTYVGAFFPFDEADRDYATLAYASELRERWNRYNTDRLRSICRCVSEDKMLPREEYLCLLFTEYMMEYPLRHPGRELESSPDCVNRFAREAREDLVETRMQLFFPDREPQMTRALLQAVCRYQKKRTNPD